MCSKIFNDCLFKRSFSAILYTSIEEEIKILECCSWLKLGWWKDCTQIYTDLILHKYVCEDVCYIFTDTHKLEQYILHCGIRVFDKNFRSAPNWLNSYMPTMPQSTVMSQSHSVSIEGLNHVAPKWSNRSSKLSHLVFPLGQWCIIVAYLILCCGIGTT